MYAKAKHSDHALATLQQASLARLARLLQLGPRSSADAVLAETARQLGIPLRELQALYTRPAYRLTNQQFVTWSNQLQDLESQVRQRYSVPTKESS